MSIDLKTLEKSSIAELDAMLDSRQASKVALADECRAIMDVRNKKITETEWKSRYDKVMAKKPQHVSVGVATVGTKGKDL